MSDLQGIFDRIEIEALRGEFTDAVMMRDYDRLSSLFTLDGVVRMPHINAEASSQKEIRLGIERMQALSLWHLHSGSEPSRRAGHLEASWAARRLTYAGSQAGH